MTQALDLLRQLKVDRLEAQDRLKVAVARTRLASQKRRAYAEMEEKFFADLSDNADPMALIKAEDEAAREQQNFREAWEAETEAARELRRATKAIRLLLQDIRSGQSSLPLIESAPGIPRGEDPPAPAPELVDEAEDDQADVDDEPPPPFESLSWSQEVIDHELLDLMRRHGIIAHFEVEAFPPFESVLGLREVLKRFLPEFGMTPPDISEGLYGYRWRNTITFGLMF